MESSGGPVTDRLAGSATGDRGAARTAPEAKLYERDLLAHLVEDLGEGYGEIELDTPLLEIGVLDSLRLQELLTWIEDRYDVLLPPEKLRPERFNSIRQMAEVVVESLAGDSSVAELDYFEILNRLAESHGLTRQWLELPTGKLHLLTTTGNEDPTLVLLAGLGTPASSWGIMMRTLNRRRRTVAIDLPGFGVSPAPASADFSFAAQVDAVLATLDATVPGAFVAVGHSAGAMIAAEIARHRPERCRGLMAISFGRVGDGASWWATLREMSRDPGVFWERAFYRPPPLGRALRDRLLSMLASPAYLEFLDTQAVAGLDGTFQGLELPAVFLGGSDDRIIESEILEQGAQQLPGAELSWIARCGHNAHVERPEAVLVYVEHFLRRLEKP